MGLQCLILIGVLAYFPLNLEAFGFPDNFLFGVSTAAYQIEGGWDANQKGESIWDHMCHTTPSKIVDGSNGDLACDSYHQFREDLKALTYLGVNFYRFSISWPRVLPTGFINHINEDGIQYYREMIDSLLESNIEPMITLYHWDLPQKLQDLGGWTNPNIIQNFVEYANLMFKTFGCKVKYWITINEPGEICGTGYGIGVNAPGINMSGVADYLCGRNLLLAHAQVYRLYTSSYKRKGTKIGISISTPWYQPKTNTTADCEAANRALQMEFGWWAHPIFSKSGDYPDIMKKRIHNISMHDNFTHSRLPPFSREEVKFIRGTADFFGLNHYTTYLVADDDALFANQSTSHAKDVGVRKEVDPSWPSSKAAWLKVVPWGFSKILNWIKDEYNNPCIYVTENGYADDGELVDMDRVRYLQSYLKQLLKAIFYDGVNVKAYSVWSLMDNWEWADGYTLKFGLYYVEFSDCTRPRKPKSSVNFYRDLISMKDIPAICFEGAPIVPKVERVI